MKAEMPERLARRPQWRGFPIPYTTMVGSDGVPNFKVTDIVAWEHCVAGHLCALCTEPLDYWCWYLGSIEHYQNENVFDLGMHRECAEYAARVCPYIAYGKAYGNEIGPVKGAVEIIELAPRESMSNEGVPIYLFRGRSKSIRVIPRGKVNFVKTGKLYEARLIVRRDARSC